MAFLVALPMTPTEYPDVNFIRVTCDQGNLSFDQPTVMMIDCPSFKAGNLMFNNQFYENLPAVYVMKSCTNLTVNTVSAIQILRFSPMCKTYVH